MHTDTTLAVLDNQTTALGEQLRHFQSVTCSAYSTSELKREMAARKRRESRRQSKVGSSLNIREKNQRRPKIFNLNTYKAHSFGDYVATIKRYGTTDSYTTAIVCCYIF
jgi:hypothetical protein